MARQGLGLVFAAIILCGCSGSDSDESLSKKTGGALGEAVTDFAAGLGSGVDKGLDVSVEFSDKAAARGMSSTVGKKRSVDGKGITIYVLAEQPVKAQLVAKAMNKDNQEIGRSAVAVELVADDAKYVDFNFANEVDIQRVVKYVIDVKDLPPERSTAPEGAETLPESDGSE